MRWLILILSCLSCEAQFPLSTGAGIEWTRPASSALSPVAGYIFWYAATNGIVGTTGASPPGTGERIKSWADLGPNGYNLTNLAASTLGPKYEPASTSVSPASATNPPSNTPYIFWSSDANVYLTNKFSTSYTQPNTYFMVLNGQAGRSANPILNPVANQNQQITWPPGQAQPTLYAGSAQNGPLTATPNAADNNWVVYTFQFNGSSSILRSNSVSLTLSGTTVGTGTLQGITLGNYFNLSAGSGNNVLMVEFMGYNSALSSGDMTSNERYLAKKYGMTLVP